MTDEQEDDLQMNLDLDLGTANGSSVTIKHELGKIRAWTDGRGLDASQSLRVKFGPPVEPLEFFLDVNGTGNTGEATFVLDEGEAKRLYEWLGERYGDDDE